MRRYGETSNYLFKLWNLAFSGETLSTQLTLFCLLAHSSLTITLLNFSLYLSVRTVTIFTGWRVWGGGNGFHTSTNEIPQNLSSFHDHAIHCFACHFSHGYCGCDDEDQDPLDLWHVVWKQTLRSRLEIQTECLCKLFCSRFHRHRDSRLCCKQRVLQYARQSFLRCHYFQSKAHKCKGMKELRQYTNQSRPAGQEGDQSSRLHRVDQSITSLSSMGCL